MPGYERAHVLHAYVPLDDADREVAHLTTGTDDEAGQDELERAEVGERETQRPGDDHGDRERAERALDRLVRADLGAQLALAEQLAADERRHVVDRDTTVPLRSAN